jgi:hypothetical protein
MRRTLQILLLIVAALLSNSSSYAQESKPLIFWAQGDLWAWTEATQSVTQLTADGTISGATLSPDGTSIAYRSLSAISRMGLDGLQADGAIANFDLPTDIILLTLQSGETTTLAAQDPRAALTPGGSIVRSEPAWSPDGTAIAWVEFSYQSLEASLVQQPLGAAPALITSLPLESSRAPLLRWSSAGFAVRFLTLAGDGTSSFALYAPDGSTLPALRLQGQPTEYLQTFDWVQTPTTPLLGVLFSSSRWVLFDPLAGSEVPSTTVPVLRQRTPTGAAPLRFATDVQGGFFWETLPANPSEVSIAFPGAPGQVALSPDGSAIAFSGYPEFGALAIWRNGSIIEVSQTGSSDPTGLLVSSLLWSTSEWWLSGE